MAASQVNVFFESSWIASLAAALICFNVTRSLLGNLTPELSRAAKRRRLERIVRHVRSGVELRGAHAGKPICSTKSSVVSAAWNPLWLLLCRPMQAVDLELDLAVDAIASCGAMHAVNDVLREQELR